MTTTWRTTTSARSWGLVILCSGGIACGPDTPSTDDTSASTSDPTTTSTQATTSTADSTGTTMATPPSTTTDASADSTGSTSSGEPPFWCNGELLELECVDETMPTAIEGATPLGPVVLPWGYAGLFLCGTCFLEDYVSELYFIPSYADLPTEPWTVSEGMYIGEVEATVGEPQVVLVELFVGPDMATTQGTLTLTSIPDPELLAGLGPASMETAVWEGTLEVEGDNWSIASSFVTTACGVASIGIPCE